MADDLPMLMSAIAHPKVQWYFPSDTMEGGLLSGRLSFETWPVSLPS